MGLIEAIQNNPLILLIPFIAGFVGWFTNVVALKMTFHPVQFIGIGKVGWQGVVPANSEHLSLSFIKLLKEKLLNVEEIFSDSEEELGEDLDPVVDKVTKQVIDEIANNLAPENWSRAHAALQEYIEDLVRKSTRKVVLDILSELKKHAEEFIDLEEVVLDAVRKDTGLLGHLLTGVAGPEMRFIERSGFWFGLFFGIFQMFLWVKYPAWWILPIGGFLVGYITNFFALRLVFEPHEPIKIGPIEVQGMIHKRKIEVSQRFADIMAGDILNPDNMLETVAEGESSDKVLSIVEERVDTLFKEYKTDPMAAILIPAERMDEAHADLMERVRNGKPERGGLVESFLGNAVKIRDQINDKLSVLDPKSFEGVLRPAFQADEWKLFLTGAVLGAGAGTLQLFYLFGEVLA